MKENSVKYKTMNLPDSLVAELTIWREAYSNIKGKRVTFAEMLTDMIACNEKFKWWRNSGREIITEYKAIHLAEAKGISLKKKKKKVIKHDNDQSTSSRGQNSVYSGAYTMLDSGYVWNKDWREIDW